MRLQRITRVCLTCGASFEVQPNIVRCGWGKFCSRHCKAHGPRPGPSHEERFWAKVGQSGPNDCWPWRGTPAPVTGYGRFTAATVTYGAHVYAYTLAHGPVPKGLCVCHTCDNPPCCNPAHLFLGTTSDNIKDMHEKGRATTRRARGEAHPSARLTAALVQQMRAEHAAGGVFQKDLAAKYGVNQATVNQILRREIWAHVT